MQSAAIEKSLIKLGDATIAAHSQRFFKSGPGEYAEGDKFLGVRVPDIRRIAKKYSDTEHADIELLLQSPWHEVRLFALILWVNQFKRADESHQKRIVNSYLKLRRYVNNWDLVDTSAHPVTGAWFYTRDRSKLDKLIHAKSLWDRRIAMLSTLHYIREHDFTDTYRYAEILLNDKEDLMHKASGWMLREAGKRDVALLTDFLDKHTAHMPRTMLRYAIEKFSKTEKQYYLGLTKS